jgi:hypothetical protein
MRDSRITTIFKVRNVKRKLPEKKQTLHVTKTTDRPNDQFHHLRSVDYSYSLLGGLHHPL